VNAVSEKVAKHSLAYLPVQNSSRGTCPTAWKFGRNWPIPFRKAYFQSTYAHSASAEHL